MEDGKKKLELLRQNSGYRFSKDLQKVENNYNVRQVTPDYMDHIAASEIPLSDCYILEGALFFRRATARLVSMYIAYYRSYYNPDLDKEIKCIPVSSESVFSFEEDDKAYLKNIETRLRYLTRKSLLYSSKYTVSIFGGGLRR
jgi:hypothetical protein